MWFIYIMSYIGFIDFVSFFLERTEGYNEDNILLYFFLMNIVYALIIILINEIKEEKK